MQEIDTGTRVVECMGDLHMVHICISPQRAEHEWGRPPHPGSIACAPYEVNLGKLSPVARRIAWGVSTTWRRDDRSLIILESRMTDGDRLRASGFSEVAPIAEMPFGPEVLAHRRRSWYFWPAMEDDETPEEFFERCAAEIEQMDCDVAGGWGPRYFDHWWSKPVAYNDRGDGSAPGCPTSAR